MLRYGFVVGFPFFVDLFYCGIVLQLSVALPWSFVLLMICCATAAYNNFNKFSTNFSNVWVGLTLKRAYNASLSSLSVRLSLSL